MHKRLSKNANLIIEKARNSSGRNLTETNCLVIIREIIKRKGSLGKIVLDSLGVSSRQINILIKDEVNKKPTCNVINLLKKATRIAYSNKSPYVGTEHLVYGFLGIPKYAKIFKLNKKLNQANSDEITLDFQMSAAEDEMPADENFNESPENHSTANFGKKGLSGFLGEMNNALENFISQRRGFAPGQSILASHCVDLGKENNKGHILIGREKELERISHILGRKTKNNPVLVGDPGVGKTAIVEGLAQKIKRGLAPYYLTGKKILSLDLSSLVAGTSFRGEFEARIKAVIQEAKNDPDIILFIDELHNLIGTGNAMGSMDAANILKPALSRGEIQIIGATTYDEYQKHIEKDAALERRFQPVAIKEPNVNESIEILTGISPFYERYHNLIITDQAVESSVHFAKRYVIDRKLPDSAIDLIDETSARVKANIKHRNLHHETKLLEKDLERIIKEKEFLVLNDHYEKAIDARKKETELTSKIKTIKKEIRKIEDENPVVITKDDIRKTLSFTANIPLEALSLDDSSIIKRSKSNLSALINQDEAKAVILDTLSRHVSGITDPDKPLGSFIFVGPTGVGKTMTAKLLAKSISPDENESIIQINMSEFSEKHTMSRLLGAPAGYVGYEESGELIEKIRRNPYSVVLFDEIEKADPSILNILLQILEEGELTSAKGKKVNFRNSIIILTSNIGTNELNQLSILGFEFDDSANQQQERTTKDSIKEDLAQELLPELLNRIDKIVIFENLRKKDIAEITQKELKKLSLRIEKSRNIQIKFDEKIADLIQKESLDPKQGARLIKKNIASLIEPVLAQKILENKNLKAIKVTLRNKKVVAIKESK